MDDAETGAVRGRLEPRLLSENGFGFVTFDFDAGRGSLLVDDDVDKGAEVVVLFDTLGLLPTVLEAGFACGCVSRAA